MNCFYFDIRPAARRCLVLSLLILLTGLGCGDGSDSDTEPDASTGDTMEADAGDTAPTNSAPQAQVDAPETVAVGDLVSLDATPSTDPDGDALSFTWSLTSQPSGSSATLNAASTAKPTFTPDAAGAYEFSVDVSDGQASDTATVTVDALAAPTAEAGPDKSGEVGDSITLDASGSSSSGGATLEFQWSFVTRPQGSSASFADATAETTSFTADAEGTYIVKVEVSNGVNSDTDRATVQVAPQGGRLTSTVFVSKQGDDSATGTEQDPVATFGKAIDIFQNKDGVDRIELAEGTYNVSDSTTISNDLDIAGPSADDTTATLESSGQLIEVATGGFVSFFDISIETTGEAIYVGEDAGLSLVGVTCRASTCVRSGDLLGALGGRLEVRQSELIGHSSGSTSGILGTSAESVTIVESTVRDFENSGVNTTNGGMTVRDSTFENNGEGVKINFNDTNQGTSIMNTTFSGNGSGVVAAEAKNVSIQGSTIDSSSMGGVFASGGAVSLNNSIVRNGSDHGVKVIGNAVVTIRESQIISNQGSGVRVEGEDARVNLGTNSTAGNNSVLNNVDVQIDDARPDSATGRITLSDTVTISTATGAEEPPPGTYSGPNFANYGITIANNTSVTVY